jgi:hypothetical protein
VAFTITNYKNATPGTSVTVAAAAAANGCSFPNTASRGTSTSRSSSGRWCRLRRRRGLDARGRRREDQQGRRRGGERDEPAHSDHDGQSTAMWDFSLTATEMQAAQVMVTVAGLGDQGRRGQMFIIETYGNAGVGGGYEPAQRCCHCNAKTASQAGDAMALTGGERTTLAGVINTTATVESYRANGAAPTPAQFMSEVLAHLGESSISGTTKTTHKLDHATTAQTFTLDSGTAPTSITRAT